MSAKQRPSVDSESFALAQHFLRDSDIDAQKFTACVLALAAAIQMAIDDWLQENGVRS